VRRARPEEALVITIEETEREKRKLPRLWGRFGKSIDRLIEVSEPDESLLAACITLNPEFTHRTITLAGGLVEMTKSTNVVLAATDRRVLVLATGIAGGARDHHAIPYEGLQVAGHGKTDVTLRWSEGEARFAGAAKTMVADLVAAIESRVVAAG
jgi:hypothetical protein